MSVGGNSMRTEQKCYLQKDIDSLDRFQRGVEPPRLAGKEIELDELFPLKPWGFQSEHVGAGFDVGKPEITFVVGYGGSPGIRSLIQKLHFSRGDGPSRRIFDGSQNGSRSRLGAEWDQASDENQAKEKLL